MCIRDRILAARGDYVEGGCGAKVHHHAGAAVALECGDGVDEAVRAQFRRIIDKHRHSGFDARLNKQRLNVKVVLADLAQR